MGGLLTPEFVSDHGVDAFDGEVASLEVAIRVREDNCKSFCIKIENDKG
jgi:hypothetical protein